MRVRLIRPERCVRCGRAERVDDSFVCGACKVDPAMRAEMAAVAVLARDGIVQRRLLVTGHGWAGGWPAVRTTRQ